MEHANPGTGKFAATYVWTKRTLLFLFVTIVLVVVSALALIAIYEDDVKNAFISEINRSLEAEVRVNPANINFTILSSFPDCSIRLTDVLMFEAIKAKQRDTLLYAGSISLHFNVYDLWKGRYDIRKLLVRDAIIKPVVSANGKNNYSFWKVNRSDNNQEKKLDFKLRLLGLHNFQVHYTDRQAGSAFNFRIDDLRLKGEFHADEFELGVTGKLDLRHIAANNTIWLKDKLCLISGDLKVSDGNYEIRSATLKLNQLLLDVRGGFLYSDNTFKELELRYKFSDPDISQVLSLLPAKYQVNISEYESHGNLYAQGSVKYKNKTSYSLNADFGISNGTVLYKPKSAKAVNLNLEGKIAVDPVSTSLSLENIRSTIMGDSVGGYCRINSFSDPRLEFGIKGKIGLANLLSMFPAERLDSITGTLAIDCKAEGLLSELRQQTFSEKVAIELNASVRNMLLKFKSDPLTMSVSSCSLTAKNRHILISGLQMKRGDSDLRLEGELPQFFRYLSEKDFPLTIRASLSSQKLDLADFLYGRETKGSDSSGIIPSNINFYLESNIHKLILGKFQASGVKGSLEIRDRKLIASDLSLNAMGGTAVISVYLDNNKNDLKVAVESTINGVDVKTMFYQLNSFGQNTLTDENLRGELSAKIEFSGSWNASLQPDLNSMKADADVTIKGGELIDYKPLLNLSRFLDISELKRVKFSELKSDVHLKNSRIKIPKTTVNNSALNIEISGVHGFDNKIDYHFSLLISDLIAARRKNRQDEFGPAENDPENRRRAFILMTGTVEDPVIRFDKQGLRQKIKEDIKVEKQNLKQIIREEIAAVKKSGDSPKKIAEPQTFELEKSRSDPPEKTLQPKKKKNEDEDF